MNNELQLTRSEMVQHDPEQGSSALSREWQTLALGLSEGAARTGSQTANDFRQSMHEFAENPLSASGNFLKNHWTDVVAGAAITFMKPGAVANAALLAYSMRGAAYSVFEAARDALDPNANVQNLSDKLAGSLSQQGSAFLSSMPLALLGGNLGKAGAGAVFGKGLGAADFLSLKVSLEQVKNNLWDIHDTVAPPPVRLVISDMDNTLASHGKYFAEGVEKALSDLANKTSIPESELYASIGHQMEVARSHDYPWSLEIAIKDRLKVGEAGGMSVAEFEKNIVKPFWSTIDDSLVKNFKPFPGVTETLQTLKERNIPVAVLSDAPAFMGLGRLVNLGLDDGLIQRFYGLKNWKIPQGMQEDLLKSGQERVDKFLRTPNKLDEFRAIDASWEKPDPHGFKLLMKEYGVRPKETLMIGDSRVKDVGVADLSGARAIWAKYGTPGAQDEAVLARLRPPPENSGGVGSHAVASGSKSYAPYLEAADSYSSILNHLNPKANYAEIAANTARAIASRPDFKASIAAFAWPKTEPDNKLKR